MMKQLFMHYFLLCSTLLFISACQKEGMGNEDENPLDEIISETYNYPDGTIKMIYCPGGTFLTNEDDGDNDFEDGPELSCDPFWISETEVPNDLIAWIYNSAAGFDPNTMVLNPSFFNTEDRNAHNYWCDDYVKWGGQDLMYTGGSELYRMYDIFKDNGLRVRSGRDELPCTDITWFGAIMACNWLSFQGLGLGLSRVVYSGIDDEWIDDKTVQHTDRTGFRLPTSIEWECAARWQGKDNSGNAYEWPEGSEKFWTRGGNASGANAPVTDVGATSSVAVYKYREDGYTNPADKDEIRGDRAPNALGLYDMSGNVWEWCFDEDESGYSRIMKGGSWGTGYSDMRISSHWEMNASGHGSDLGFRLVLSAGE